MRICYIADGSSIHTQRWLNYFAQKGHEVHLISPMPTAGEGFAKGVQLHLLVRLMPRIWPVTRYFSGLLWLAQTRRLLRKIKPDIVDAHFITVNGYLAVASGFHPLVLSVWGSDILIAPKQNAVYKFLAKQALRKADRVLCVSPAIKEESIQLGANSQKVEVTLIGVDTKRFSPAQRNTMIFQKLNISDLFPVVMSTRGHRSVYNIETLVKAIPLVLEEAPEARFIITGQGEQTSYLERLAQDLGITDNTKFVGQIPDEELVAYLASSVVYVSTSLSDGTSASLLEAMACGLAPVVTDIPANRPWIKDGENGFLVPVKDHKTLATKITYLIKNAEIRREFGKANRRIVQEKAKYETQMAKVERIYQGLVEGAECQ